MLEPIHRLIAAANGEDLFKDLLAAFSMPTTLGFAWLANLTSAQVTLLLGLVNLVAVLIFRFIELRRRTKQDETIDRLQARLDRYENIL